MLPGQHAGYSPNVVYPSQNLPQPFQQQERHWYDKLVDVIVGDEGPDTKYALICENCFAHNGLALAQELDDVRECH